MGTVLTVWIAFYQAGQPALAIRGTEENRGNTSGSAMIWEGTPDATSVERLEAIGLGVSYSVLVPMSANRGTG